jgi:hypothetical protein
MSKRSLFGRSTSIARRIDEFLDEVSESALVLVAMVEHSIPSGSSAKGRRTRLAAIEETLRVRPEEDAELDRGAIGGRERGSRGRPNARSWMAFGEKALSSSRRARSSRNSGIAGSSSSA